MRKYIFLLMLLWVSSWGYGQEMTGYEYWLDGNYDSRTVVNGATNGESLSLSIDLEGVATGIHTFNFRTIADDGHYGGISRYLFYNSEAQTGGSIAGYEYWLDNDYANRTVVNSEQVSNVAMDISGVTPGLHTFNIRAKSTKGHYGGISRYLFYNSEVQTDGRISGYEYWLDNDYANRTVVNSEQVSNVAMNISGATPGLHTFNFRAKGVNGHYGGISRYLFYNSEAQTDGSIAGYEYWLDNDYANRTVVNSEQVSNVAMDISAASSGLHTFNFRAKSVNGHYGGISRYLFYVKKVNNGQLSSIAYWLDNDSTQRQQVSVNDTIVNFSIDISNLPGGVHSLNVQELNGVGLVSQQHAYTFESDAIHIPAPHITHVGNSIRMNTETEQAVIYYTMDGTAPDSTSTVYSKPFAINHNCTIKAIAMRGKDYPSEVTAFVVDWFKVADVTFAHEGNVVSLATATEGATIHYTLSNNEEGEKVYSEPLTMTGDCTISAYATREGYNNSDTARYEFHADGVTVATPVIAHSGNRVGMSTTTPQAVIHYTLDGTVPNDSSIVYTDSIIVSQNCTIKAIALRENYYPSQVATLVVDWFKVADVTFAQEGNVVSLSTETESATIHYTLSNNNEGENVYSEPLTMTGDCTISAYATRDGYNSSDTTRYEFHADGVTVAMPVIAHDGNRIGMSTTTEQATIHYTTDGSTPDETSAVYTDSITVSRNCIVKAIALRENYFPSQVATLEVDWFKVADVTFAQVGYIVSLSTATDGATIRYTLSNNSEGEQVYSEPLKMTGDCTISAYAIREGFNSSDTTRYEFHADGVTVATPVIAHSGNRIGISTTTEQAVIHYTMDGTTPDETSAVYTDSITTTHNCTIKAIALRDNYFPSEVATFEVDWMKTMDLAISYDGRYFTLTAAEHAQISYTIDEGEVMPYEGRVEVPGLCTVKATAQEEGLLPATLTYEVNSFFDGVTARIREGGSTDEAFTWCGGVAQAEGLAAIIWSRNDAFPQEVAGRISNPNLLLYVKDRSQADGTGIGNVVANGIAQQITLTDNLQDDGSYGPADFFAPQSFHVQDAISYTHRYTQRADIGTCEGWETIALPFDVQTVTHEKNGTCAPFAANNTTGAKPFWLCELTEQGFADAQSIRANTPYIIAMPENEQYLSSYRLAGEVKFTARDVDVPATEPQTATRAQATFIPAFAALHAADSLFVLNVGQPTDGHRQGSVFVSGLRGVRPFEAYRTTTQAGVRRMPIADELGEATGIHSYELRAVHSDRVFNLQGLPVKTPGKGVYIKNGKKVICK